MWAGGDYPRITDDAGYNAALDEQNRLAQDLADQETHTREQNNDYQDASHKSSRRYEDRQLVQGERQHWLGEERARTNEVRAAQNAKNDNDHSNMIACDQLAMEWRNQQSSLATAWELQGIYNCKLHSTIIREVSAFLQEERQRRGEIELSMFKAWKKAREAMLGDGIKSSTSVEPYFANYTHIDFPQNDALAAFAHARGEYNRLIEKGRLLQKQTSDPFFTGKLQEAIHRLEVARGELDFYEQDLATARSTEQASRNNMLSARKAVGEMQDEAQGTRNQQNDVNAEIQKRINELNAKERAQRAEQLERQRQQGRAAP